MNIKRQAIGRAYACPRCGSDEWRKRNDRGYYCAPCGRQRSGTWQKANPEKKRVTAKRWYAANSEKAREKAREYRKRHPARISKYSREWKARNQVQALWYGARQRAAKAGLPFTITPADIVIPTHCPVFGVPLVVEKNRARPWSPSVDRIIPTLGYVPGNIAVISWRANNLKRDATAEELRRVADWTDSWSAA